MLSAQGLAYFEYEAPNTFLDAQISYSFPKQGLTLKLSASNLLDSKSIFYVNNVNDYQSESTESGRAVDATLKPGMSDGYDKEKDPVLYQSHSGRSVSFSASWTF